MKGEIIHSGNRGGTEGIKDEWDPGITVRRWPVWNLTHTLIRCGEVDVRLCSACIPETDHHAGVTVVELVRVAENMLSPVATGCTMSVELETDRGGGVGLVASEAQKHHLTWECVWGAGKDSAKERKNESGAHDKPQEFD